jgi:serine/threonine kinase PknH
VDAAALPGLLLPEDQINQRMNTSGMTAIPVESALLYGSVTPPHCTGAWGPVYDLTYNGSGYTALAVQGVFGGQTHRLVQAVVAFPDAAAAKAFYDKQVADWNACKSTHIRFEFDGGVTEADVGVPSVTGDLLSVMLVPTTSQVAGQQCERDMTVRGNVVVDVRACSPTVGSAGSSIAREIADKVGRNP